MNDLVRDGYVLTTDPKRVDFARVHRWLAEESYWAAGRSHDLVARSIDGSLPYSIFTTRTPPAADVSEGTSSAADASAADATAGASPAVEAAARTQPAADAAGRVQSSAGAAGRAESVAGALVGAGSAAAAAAPTRLPAHLGVDEVQVGFARAVTDGATFAWICDVFVDQDHRGHGLGKWLIDSILADLSGRGIQRFLLATKDAHEVYRRSGFAELAGANRFMEIDRRPTRNAILGKP
jgi:GNAT superfamily N-acetyltransferase